MASCPISFYTVINDNRHARAPLPACNSATVTNSMSFGRYSNSESNPRHSFFVKRSPWPGRCHATSPPEESPSSKRRYTSAGLTTTITRFQDTLQIFFAVLFWMSLFFWSSVWDGGNGGTRNKGSRFRK